MSYDVLHGRVIKDSKFCPPSLGALKSQSVVINRISHPRIGVGIFVVVIKVDWSSWNLFGTIVQVCTPIKSGGTYPPLLIVSFDISHKTTAGSAGENRKTIFFQI